jgi:hypothetical protein
MSRQTFKHTLFLAGMLIASTAFADPELVRCVDPEGHVTLTDTSCQERGESVLEVRLQVAPQAAPVSEPGSTASPAAAPAPAGKTIIRQRPLAALVVLPRNAWANKAVAGRSVSLDVETLKAARLNMQTQDGASVALRQQRLAALN